jgi:hypothetical protein
MRVGQEPCSHQRTQQRCIVRRWRALSEMSWNTAIHCSFEVCVDAFRLMFHLKHFFFLIPFHFSLRLTIEKVKLSYAYFDHSVCHVPISPLLRFLEYPCKERHVLFFQFSARFTAQLILSEGPYAGNSFRVRNHTRIQRFCIFLDTNYDSVVQNFMSSLIPQKFISYRSREERSVSGDLLLLQFTHYV